MHAESFALHHAQLVLARSFGFESWPRLKAYVDGVTVVRLADAVRAGDLAAARSMLEARPELANLCMAEDDEHRALHYAVLQERPEMVRLLMQHGADPHIGIWPHRVATSALTLATERGLTDIVAIIRAERKQGTVVPFAAWRHMKQPTWPAALERGDEAATDRDARSAPRAHHGVKQARLDGSALGRGTAVAAVERLAVGTRADVKAHTFRQRDRDGCGRAGA